MAQNHLNGSAVAGKAGESAPKGVAAGAQGQDRVGREKEGLSQSKILSSEAVAALLKSEFAAPDEPEAPAEEQTNLEAAGATSVAATAPDGAGAATGENQNSNEVVTGEAVEGKERRDASPTLTETETEAPDGANTGEATADEVPAVLREAIEAWEAKGGGELPPALQGLVQKRLNKLTSEREREREAREAAEARVAELEAASEAEDARSRSRGTTGEDAGRTGGLDGLDEKGLMQLESAGRRFVRDAEGFLDDSATDEERERVQKFMEANHLDERGLKRQVRTVRDSLAEVPQRRQALTEYRKVEVQASAKAKELFPWMKDKADPRNVIVQEVLRTFPEIRRNPAHQLALGCYALGYQEVEKLTKAAQGQGQGQGEKRRDASSTLTAGGTAATPKTTKAPVKAPAGTAAQTSRVSTSREQALEAQRQEFRKNLTREGAAKLLVQELRG